MIYYPDEVASLYIQDLITVSQIRLWTADPHENVNPEIGFRRALAWSVCVLKQQLHSDAETDNKRTLLTLHADDTPAL